MLKLRALRKVCIQQGLHSEIDNKDKKAFDAEYSFYQKELQTAR